MIRAFTLALCCLFAACNRSSDDAKKTASGLVGAGTASTGDNVICNLFSQAEAAKYVGESVGPGHDAAGGCQWTAKDQRGDMIVAVVPAQYHEPPKRAPGYRPLEDIGTQGFVAPYLGGWLAGAIVGQNAIRVSVVGSGATAGTAITLLKDTIKRRH